MSSPVRYRVDPSHRHEHLFTVETRFPATARELDLWMPLWTPGSYLLREFARHVQDFAAFDGNGAPLAWSRRDKNTFRIQPAGAREVVLRYRVYANDLTVRTSHLDESHGYFNGANLFLTSDQHRGAPCELAVTLPSGWKAFCALPSAGSAFRAKDFDELVDSPVEMGPHDSMSFIAAGKLHELVIWGQGNFDRAVLARDLTTLCETEAKLFGGSLPFERYLFIVHLTDKGRGGLEHAASTTLLVPRFTFRPQKSYEDFLSLASHEYFHLWNVKRVKPKALVPFDYQRENYTTLLWAFEGITSYYDTLLLRRAGLIDGKRYLEKLGEAITGLETVPGRTVQPVTEASLLAWIKLYRPDENTPNSAISYYVKGEIVAMLLDLHLRAATGGQRSLDDLMRLLFERYGDGRGVPEDGVEAAAVELGGPSLKAFFDKALRSHEELDYTVLSTVGLALKRRPRKNGGDKGGGAGDEGDKLWLGVDFKGGSLTVSTAYAGGPAAQAGLYADDEIVALDGFRITNSTLAERLEERKPGDKVRLTVFRRDALTQIDLTLAPRPRDACWLEKRADATDAQKAAYASWLGEGW